MNDSSGASRALVYARWAALIGAALLLGGIDWRIVPAVGHLREYLVFQVSRPVEFSPTSAG